MNRFHPFGLLIAGAPKETAKKLIMKRRGCGAAIAAKGETLE